MATLDKKTDWSGSYSEFAYGIEFDPSQVSTGSVTLPLIISNIGEAAWQFTRPPSDGITFSTSVGLSFVGKDGSKYLEAMSLDNSNDVYRATSICKNKVFRWQKLTKQSLPEMGHVTFSLGVRN